MATTTSKNKADTSRVKVTNAPSLKSQGAGYSVTNRKGETTYYKSPKDVDSGNSPISKVNKTGGVISLDRLQPTKVAELPPPPKMTDPGDIAGANMAGIQSMLDGTTTTGADGSVEEMQSDSNKKLLDTLKSYLGIQPELPDQAKLYTDTYGVSEKQLARDEKQARTDVKNQTASLNSIIAKQQSDLLQLRGTGSANGVTEAVYGGQQAQINREAAIAALPVQAALLAAQGNLDEATKQIDKLFDLKKEEATAKYNYQSKMVDAVFNFATTAQQNLMTAKLADRKEKKDKELSDLEFERQIYLKNLTEGGVGGLTPAQINSTVNSIAGAYDNEPLVKEYNTIKRNVDIYNGLGNSATDDIQRVYTFAKVADPNSAVKEGEYDSIEKYSQALLGRVGLKVSRVFTATGILTPEARKAMGDTLKVSLNAAEVGKNQVQSEYQRQIDDAYAGKNRTITEYTPPQPMGPVQPPNKDEVAYDEIVSNKPGYFSRLWGALLGN